MRLMNAKHHTAPGTGPPYIFIFNEFPDSGFLYVHEILNHAHSVLGSITLIEVVQPVAGEMVTAEAIPGPALRQHLAVLDTAVDAGF